MSDTGDLATGDLDFSNDQRCFLRFLFKLCNSKLTAELKKSKRESCTSIYNLLNQIVFDTCADIVKKSEKPKSCMEKFLACGGKDGTEFIEVLNEMQEKQLLEAMMRKAEEEVGKITANPQLETKKFIEELFEILGKFAKPKQEEPEADLTDEKDGTE